MTPIDKRPTGRARLDSMLLVPALLTSGFVLANLAAFGNGRDHSVYTVVADVILRGGLPYRDAWDIKPPGIFLLFAMARAVPWAGEHAIRILEAAGLASLFLAFPILSRRFTGNTGGGLIGAAIAVLTHAQLEFWHTAQPEAFAGVAVPWAIVAATWRPPGSTGPAGRRLTAAWIGSGALYGGAFLLKPHLAAGAAVTLGLVARGRRAAGEAESIATALLRPGLAMAAGAAPILTLVAGWFLAGGAWDAMWRTMTVFAPRYAGIDVDPVWGIELSLRAIEQAVFWFSPFFVVGLPALLLPSARAAGTSIGMAHLAGVAAIQLAGVAAQGKFIPYHYSAALPLLSLLAGWGLWGAWLRARERLWLAAGFVAAMGVLACVVTPTQMEEGGDYRFWPRCGQRLRAWLDPAIRTAVHDRLYSHYDMNAAANRAVADWIRSNTPAGSTIFVWGFEPAIYVLSGRNPASRFIQNQPLRVPWERQEHRALLMEELRAARPAAIVVQRNDVIPVVTGDRLDSAAALMEFAGLREELRARYTRAVVIEDFEIHVRR